MKSPRILDRLTTSRRIARALERIAEAQESIAKVMVADFERRYPTRRGKTELEIGSLDMPRIEEEWRKREEAEFRG
jgi:hypothetical protein